MKDFLAMTIKMLRLVFIVNLLTMFPRVERNLMRKHLPV
jgi:hypothetical protein